MFSGIEEKSLEISTVKFKLRCRYGIIMLDRKYISGVVSVKLQGNRNTKQLHKIRFVTKVKKKNPSAMFSECCSCYFIGNSF